VKTSRQFVICIGLVCALTTTGKIVRAERPISSTTQIQIPRVIVAPRLIDYLDGRSRSQDLQISDFRQRDPHDGQPSTSPTRVFLSYDDSNIYAVFVCQNSAGRTRAHLSRRDDLTGDETVSFMLDTLHDGRHAYEFVANPLGIQMDGLITEGQDEDFSFDTLWHSEGQLTPDGFVVWMAIPFKSLRFNPGHGDSWGIALARYIPTNNESSTWPLLTRKIEAYVPQFATLQALENIHAGHNLQLSPHLLVSRQRFLDQSGVSPLFRQETEHVAGLDAKYVVRDGLTFDFTANPDFSQVESDEPQVTVNQRYEVYFPEKRPFFTESASYFQTPEDLFFSRRIVDPQYGARMTGKISSWTLGLLSIDDRAPSQPVVDDQNSTGRAHVGVARVQRDFGRESTLGVFYSQSADTDSANRVLSVDTRLKLSPNWVATAQAVHSADRAPATQTASGRSYLAEIEHGGRHLNFDTTWHDRSPNFRAGLGFIQRVDLKQIRNNNSYRWHPESGPILGFGPGLTSLIDWDHRGRLQDWSLDLPLTVNLKRSTSFTIGREEVFERFQNVPFRENATYASLSSELVNWASVSLSYVRGTDINYFPASGLAPFLAKSADANVALTLRPTSRIQLTETYLFDQLHAAQPIVSEMRSQSIFNDHVLSTRLSIQFTRAFSFRTIVDYNAVISNPSLVDLDPSKVIRTDSLFTYMLNPGTAIYAGYSNRYENLALRGPLAERISDPNMQTGSQVFVKISYSFRP
jgi:hypothetical protein